MNFIVCIIMVTAISLLLTKQIKKYRLLFYIIALICAGFTAFYSFLSAPTWFKDTILYAFQRGSLSTAFFTVVMFATLFKNGTWIKKRLMSIRAELSIIGCILALGHNILTGKTYFKVLFTDPGRLNTTQLIASLISVVLIAIMIPLMITSFESIRKRMNQKKWKKLQRMAYPFYILIYVHVMVLTLPLALAGRTRYIPNIIIYSIVFLTYSVLRIMKAKKDSAARHKNVLTQEG